MSTEKINTEMVMAFIFFVAICSITAICAIAFEPKQPKIRERLIETNDYLGTRIPATNYVIHDNDTLLIKEYRCYYTQVLTKAEKQQARDYIKSIRE